VTPQPNPPVTIGDSHRTYTSLAETAIREMVLDGRLAPGARLNEVVLAHTLQISRGPLREAIQRLASQGLLQVVSHRGAFVRSFGRDELADLYDLRIALETHAVRVGVQRATDGEIAELREVLEATQRILASRPSRYPSDLDFHRRLVELAHNPVITAAFASALVQIGLARSRSSSDPARARVALADHLEVLTHVVERDGHRAAASLRRHLEGALANALTVLELVP